MCHNRLFIRHTNYSRNVICDLIIYVQKETIIVSLVYINLFHRIPMKLEREIQTETCYATFFF